MKSEVKFLMISVLAFFNVIHGSNPKQVSDANQDPNLNKILAYTLHASKGRCCGLCCFAPIDIGKGPLFIQEVKKEIIPSASMGIEIYNLSGNRDIEIRAGYTFVILNNSNAGDISFPGPFQGKVKLVGDSTVGRIIGGVIE